ncbi:uncharacterized protein LOC120131847 [Hibiscus syriacus]|uniref:uncharacterized protein LOC120131847 n=1 Tax=Hibiscus syriacus TaxID=106335 RepID=UPI00192073DE|nr:uncharacterized protein LOC120131847 [Hibiscus syriacus]
MKVSTIWDALRDNRPQVYWQKIIWFPLHIPKHSLISWMALLDRLPTKVRLHQMGIINECHCLFCNDPWETREHLFLHCHMAQQLWNSVFTHTGLQLSITSWDVFFAWASSTWKGKSLLTLILKLALNSLIYVLWEERNRRLFQGQCRNTRAVYCH